MAQDELVPGEEILLITRRHPILLIGRVWKLALLVLALAVLGGILPLTGPVRDLRWFIIAALVLLMLIFIDIQWIVWRSETFTITNERVILKRGVIGRFSRSIGMTRVQDVTITQRLFGRIFGYGTVEIESAGKDGAEILSYVPQPAHFRNVLFERLHGQGAQPAAF